MDGEVDAAAHRSGPWRVTRLMSAIIVNCPSTGVAVVTGQHATQAQFDAGDFSGRFRCTSCGEIHAWEKADAQLVVARRFATG